MTFVKVNKYGNRKVFSHRHKARIAGRRAHEIVLRKQYEVNLLTLRWSMQWHWETIPVNNVDEELMTRTITLRNRRDPLKKMKVWWKGPPTRAVARMVYGQ